ncbi:MAG: hypothetical protein MUC78_01100 [Bacteroidales bacterium]|nr:hypothetical protein [Bacteroidales bacterium]
MSHAHEGVIWSAGSPAGIIRQPADNPFLSATGYECRAVNDGPASCFMEGDE